MVKEQDFQSVMVLMWVETDTTGTKDKHSIYNKSTPEVEFELRLMFTKKQSKFGFSEVSYRSMFNSYVVELWQLDLYGTYALFKTWLLKDGVRGYKLKKPGMNQCL